MDKKVTKNVIKNEPSNLTTTSIYIKIIKTIMPKDGKK